VPTLAEREDALFQRFLQEKFHPFCAQHNLIVAHQSCFISYAWPETEEERNALRAVLLRVQRHLSMLGIEVRRDETHMSLGERIAGFMNASIENSGCFLLIGSPLYKGKTCFYYNGAQYIPASNAAIEFRDIMGKRTGDEQNVLVLPLMYQGDYQTAFPPTLFDNLIGSITNDYHEHLLGKADGTGAGIIPAIAKLSGVNAAHRNDYLEIVRDFFQQRDQLREEDAISLREEATRSLLIKRGLFVAATVSVGAAGVIAYRQGFFNRAQQVAETPIPVLSAATPLSPPSPSLWETTKIVVVAVIAASAEAGGVMASMGCTVS
jgi:hypothetical protein